ncbi:MAG: M20/M25/M40 family metallo-hydrolase [Anaerolineae bacterium]|nr:M20/M25/M40 family metallo-hydrolase [Anaerolineae bacterium]
MRSKLILSCLFVLVAALTGCNLTSDDAPPTLMPQARITDEPLPTLGYSTPVPGQEATATSSVVSAAPVGAQLYALLNEVSQDRLYNHVARLQGFYTRHVNSSQTSETEGVGAAARWLYSEFQQIQNDSQGNFQAFTHPFTAFHNGVQTNQQNIVGIINGTLPNTPAIVIGAHYDSRTDDLNDSSGFAPGAVDNGSGVAAMLEMARVLSTIRPRTTMIFVLFAAEEVNRQGSRKFVADYIIGYNIPIKLMINIDTIGSNNDAQGNINDRELRIFSAPPAESASRQMARMIDFIIDNYSTDLKLIFVEDIDREGRFGDHFSFHEVGIPAIRIIEALEDTPRREGRDTIEYVEFDYLRRSTRTIITTVLALSDGMPPPDNIVIRLGEDNSHRLVWEPVEGATGYIVALRSRGAITFDDQFPAPPGQTAWDCTCFAPFQSIAVAALNENGIMGPLSEEVRVP